MGTVTATEIIDAKKKLPNLSHIFWIQQNILWLSAQSLSIVVVILKSQIIRKISEIGRWLPRTGYA